MELIGTFYNEEEAFFSTLDFLKIAVKDIKLSDSKIVLPESCVGTSGKRCMVKYEINDKNFYMSFGKYLGEKIYKTWF